MRCHMWMLTAAGLFVSVQRRGDLSNMSLKEQPQWDIQYQTKTLHVIYYWLLTPKTFHV